MKMTGNTIFITGGGSGIGRGLAEALHALGNQVIISGRRRGHLDQVIKANPGMEALELDITSEASIADTAKTLTSKYPALNVLINNAGIMIPDDASAPIDEKILVSEIQTNLFGSIRMTSALVEDLKQKEESWIIYNTSALAYLPLAMFAVYSATKAALHSYALSQRFMLRNTTVKVQEIAPPWVATELLGSPDPRAMPLNTFISETIANLGADAPEVLVEGAKDFRNNVGPNEHAHIDEVNIFMLQALSEV